MRYDLEFLADFCRELGLTAQIAETSLLVNLGDGAILSFHNAERDEDCLVGFVDTPWHFHDDLMFADPRGCCIALDHLNLLSGLIDGQVLVCERHVAGGLADRWLTHSEFNDDFEHLNRDEQIVVRRADCRAPNLSAAKSR